MVQWSDHPCNMCEMRFIPSKWGQAVFYRPYSQVISVVEGTPALEDAPADGPVRRYSLGQEGRKVGETPSAISMDENTSGGFTEPKWELPSFAGCILSERVSTDTNCTREDLLMERTVHQEIHCLPTWTGQQTLFEGQGLCFSVSSSFPSARLACYFLLVLFYP